MLTSVSRENVSHTFVALGKRHYHHARMVTLGKRIREARRARGLTQKQVADAFGISRPAVTQWETDATVPDHENLVKLADMFGVSLDDLVRRSPEDEARERRRRLLALYDQLDEEGQRFIEATLKREASRSRKNS